MRLADSAGMKTNIFQTKTSLMTLMLLAMTPIIIIYWYLARRFGLLAAAS
jgi:hypothetical protein